jgi:hypothetical protein
VPTIFFAEEICFVMSCLVRQAGDSHGVKIRLTLSDTVSDLSNGLPLVPSGRRLLHPVQLLPRTWGAATYSGDTQERP